MLDIVLLLVVHFSLLLHSYINKNQDYLPAFFSLSLRDLDVS